MCACQAEQAIRGILPHVTWGKPQLPFPVMREPRVSWRCAEALLEFARLANMDTRPLVAGLPFDERTVRSAGWIAWDDYCTMVERVEAAAGGPAAIERLGAQHLAIKEVHAIASALIEPHLLFRFVFRVIDPMMFPPVEFHYEELDSRRIRVDYRIRDGARPCAALARVSLGAMRALPRYLGLPAAQAELIEHDGRTGSYRVTLPDSRTIAARLKQRARKHLDSTIALLHAFVDEAGPPGGAEESTWTLDDRLRHFAIAHDLTPRQTEVLEGIVAGLSNKEIALRDSCAENTVELHVSNLLRRLQVQNRTQLVSRFWQG